MSLFAPPTEFLGNCVRSADHIKQSNAGGLPSELRLHLSVPLSRPEVACLSYVRIISEQPYALREMADQYGCDEPDKPFGKELEPAYCIRQISNSSHPSLPKSLIGVRHRLVTHILEFQVKINRVCFCKISAGLHDGFKWLIFAILADHPARVSKCRPIGVFDSRFLNSVLNQPKH
jgi:hypothetical protein